MAYFFILARRTPRGNALMSIKALDPTALFGASGCKHPEAPAMLAGQRREFSIRLRTADVQAE